MKNKTELKNSSFRITITLICVFLVWLLQGLDCFILFANDNCLPGVNAIVKAFDTPDSYIDSLRMAVFCVLVVSHLRILFGIEFTLEDRSFKEALELEDRSFKEALEFDDSGQNLSSKLVNVILSILAGITILLSYFVSSNFSHFVQILMFIEGVIIVIFDIRFRRVLFVYDKDRGSNWFILANDIVFLIIGYLLILSLTSPIFLLNIDWLTSWLLLFVLCSIYFFIAIIEILVNYLESLSIVVKNTKADVAQSIKILTRKI